MLGRSRKLTIGKVLREVETIVRNDISTLKNILSNVLGIPESFHNDLIQLIKNFFESLHIVQHSTLSSQIKSKLSTISDLLEKLRDVSNKLVSKDIRSELEKLISNTDYRLAGLQSATDIQQIIEKINAVYNKIEEFVKYNVSKFSREGLWEELENLSKAARILQNLKGDLEFILDQLTSGKIDVRVIQSLYAHKHVGSLERIRRLLGERYEPNKLLETLTLITRKVGPYTVSPLFELPCSSD